eukprot:TRINITY_DN12574_c4_g3_i13.p1 TRINITY_DN12574_c4_g3~~TRINITY_DN12574_c4_g3_i13.p1  ORF type:complete len:440 (+),score=75.27 TRINITY_DN12574_c4_g3_i13:144-1463(+)
MAQDKPGAKEFGGPLGAAFLILWSHYILYYFWYCLETHKGQLVIPTSYSDFENHVDQFLLLLGSKAVPQWDVLFNYSCFFVGQIFLAVVMPGVTIKGRKLGNGIQLDYLCNGYTCYYASLAIVFALHYFDIWQLTELVDRFGEYLTAAIIAGNGIAVVCYIAGLYVGDTDRITGIPLYDFFMGTILNPRLFKVVDIKMVAECRWSWLTLILLTLSAAVKQQQLSGAVSPNMWLMVLAHWLYSNATVKGEHYIPATWDIFHEQFGWMLAFWNVAGVPFMYCFQSLFILKNSSDPGLDFPPIYTTFLFALLLVAYYMFDTANGQKAAYKLPHLTRPLVFPNLPWTVLRNPEVLKTPQGDLLVDGWYKYARKAQYLGDIIMALVWGLSCGFISTTPYFYVTFFTLMILHRQSRDEERCAAKYGDYWRKYKERVPHLLVPGVF